jgi:hypothetical protein
MRYELADYEWVAIKPMLPNKPRGVPRANDRRVLNRIFCGLVMSPRPNVALELEGHPLPSMTKMNLLPATGVSMSEAPRAAEITRPHGQAPLETCPVYLRTVTL